MSRSLASRSRRSSKSEPAELLDADPEWEEPTFEVDASSEGTPEALPAVLRDDADEAESIEEDRTPCVDPVSAPQRALIELFASRAELRFPGVDAKVLEARAASVRALAEEVERARALLARAEADLGRGQRELGALAERAHEYASIFARTDTELAATLETIVLRPEPAAKRRRREETTPEAPKRRGRPPKTAAVELPFAAS
jgi:hypothetical protein